MTLTCQQVAERATERLEGALAEGARLAFDRHLAGCAGCRAYVRQLEVTAQALGHLEPPELPQALAARLLGAFDAHAPRARAAEPRNAGAPAWVAGVPVAGALLVLGALLAVGHHRSTAVTDLVVAAGLGVAAVVVAASARRFGPPHAAGAAATALLGALAAGRAGPLELGEGLECVGLELAGAGVVALAAWSAARRRQAALARRVAAAGAVAGALAADAALQLVCGAHLAVAHLAAFHVGGLALVALLAARLAARPSEAVGG